jgi:putative ABC transport system ATP-binding protein
MASQVLELLETINSHGTTIIMVTHDPALAARAHRNIHILDGRASDLGNSNSAAARGNLHLAASNSRDAAHV